MCVCVRCSPVCQVAAAVAAVSSTPPLPLSGGGSSGGGLRRRGALLRQQAPPAAQQVVPGVDRHAGVFNEQVLQGVAGDRHLLATAGEARRWRDQPALCQAGGIQAEEPPFLLLIILLFVFVFSGVEGGAGGVAQKGARGARGPGHHH